jgi:hypothetical protein
MAPMLDVGAHPSEGWAGRNLSPLVSMENDERKMGVESLYEALV